MLCIDSITRFIVLVAVFTILIPVATASGPTCQHKRGGTTAPLAARACDGPHELAEECDPCDEDCILSKRSVDEPEVRMIHGNASVPWYKGEVARWHVLSSRQTPQLVFNCHHVPNICQNMCYGISCKKLPSSLSKRTGKAGTAEKRACDAARKRNQCGATKQNRCSVRYPGTHAPAGYSCDEYPFASTEQGQNSRYQAVTRCVPASENKSQGHSISELYKTIINKAMFDVRFDFGNGIISAGDPGGQGYCAPEPHNNCDVLTGWQADT